MSWSISDQFPTWGEAGESPPDGFFYEGGNQVNEKHLDYLWDSTKTLESEIQAALNDIDSDADGVVDEADAAQSASSNFDLAGNTLFDSTRGFVELGNNEDLRLATGQAIEDGGGTERLLFGNSTEFKDETGQTVIDANNSANGINLNVPTGTLRLNDFEGNFTAVEYETFASAPGRLKLTNANLNVLDNAINFLDVGRKTNIRTRNEGRDLVIGEIDTQEVNFEVSQHVSFNSNLRVDGATASVSQRIGFEDKNSRNSYLYSDTGELVGEDDGGQTKTLT